MKNKKFQPLHLIPVALFAGVLLISKEQTVPEIKREPTSIPKVRQTPQRQQPTVPKASRAPASIPPAKRGLDRIVKAQNDVSLSRGHILAANIGALPLSELPPGTKLVWNDGVYGFYEKKPGQKSIPVAYNPNVKKLFPISSIIHIRGVDESGRQQLKDQGYQEYIYFKNLKKLSLKASPDQVVQLYKDLEKQGYKVKMEVLETRPIAH